MTPRWADGPLALITELPSKQDESIHSANYVARQMALAHNGILRGLNSIYLQAAHIPKNDLTIVRDFLLYCECWCESMHHHHDSEEEYFFPQLEQATGVEGLMKQNVEQHEAFSPGFSLFHDYARDCPAEKYSGEKLKELIDAFSAPLAQHLYDEIDTLVDLAKYDSEAVKKAYKSLESHVMTADSYRIAPVVFGTADREFQGGASDFPPVPFVVPHLINTLYARRNRGAWRFNPCTVTRDRRELAFGGSSRE